MATEKEKWTLIDRSGKPLTNALFDRLSFWYRDGIRGFTDGEFSGCIRNDGTILLPAIYQGVSSILDGFAAVADSTGYYLVDLQGRPQFSNRFEQLYHSGLKGVWLVKEKHEYFLIGNDGKQVFDIRTKNHVLFRDGFAVVEIDGKFGFLNAEGKLVITPRFEEAKDFQDGLALVKTDGKFGYINGEGEFAIRPQFGSAKSFSEGRAAIWDQQGKSNGPGDWMIDTSGNRLAGPYLHIGECKEGRVGCSTTGGPEMPYRGRGYLDRNGKMVIKPAYSEAYSFNNGRAVVQIRRVTWSSYLRGEDIDCVSGLIDLQGNWVIKPSKKAPNFGTGLEGEGPFPFTKKGKMGYADIDGNVVIAPKFKFTYEFKDGVAIVALESH